MKSNHYIFSKIALLVVVISISSCSMDIAKRRYSNGWDFSFGSSTGAEISPKAKAKKDTVCILDAGQNNELEFVSNNSESDSFYFTSEIEDTLPLTAPNSYQVLSDLFVNTTKSDTATTFQQHQDEIKELNKAIVKVNYIHLLALIIFVVSILTALAGGAVYASVATPLVLNLFLAGMALLSILFPFRFIRTFRLIRFLANEGPVFLDSDNTYHEEKLKKRFRIMVNSLIFFPLGALVMSIILFKKLKTPKGYIPSDLNDFLRRKAGKYIVYSILMSLLWIYLCLITFPFLVSVLLTVI